MSRFGVAPMQIDDATEIFRVDMQRLGGSDMLNHRSMRNPVMPTARPPLAPEELASLATEIFNRQIRPCLSAEHEGQYVAIEVGAGDYEVDEDDYAAVARLRSRHPTAEIWLERVGQPTAYQLRTAPGARV